MLSNHHTQTGNMKVRETTRYLCLGESNLLISALYIFDNLFLCLLYILIMIMEPRESAAIQFCDVCKAIHYNFAIQQATLNGVNVVPPQKFSLKQ
jgi:hypothetical protein